MEKKGASLMRGQHRKTQERTFDTIQQLPSGRYRALYYGPDGSAGVRFKAPTTFGTKDEASKFLAAVEAAIYNGMDPERRERLQHVEEARRKAAALVAAAEGDSFDPVGCFVYILWDDDPNIPVYVGKSTHLMGRIRAHMRDADKRDLTRRIQLIRCQDVAEMEETERRLIWQYSPKFNIDGALPWTRFVPKRDS
jgi:hypothetical protein